MTVDHAYTLRPATSADFDFLYRLMVLSFKEHVVQIWGWDEEWQQARFRTHFDPTRYQIVVVDERDVGAVSVERKPDELFIATIEILPEYRGRGIGTAIIRSLMATADEDDAAVALQVLKVNHAARRLYERLGFTAYGETETHVLMRTT